MHSPADVRISVCVAADRMPQWEWIKWLPHNMHPTERDAAGAVRLMGPSLGALEPMLQLHDRPRFTPGGARSAPGSLPLHVVLLDGAARDPGTDAGGVDGVVVIDLSAADAPARWPGPATLGLRVTPDEVYRLPPDGTAETLIGVPDALSHAEAEALARQLAPLRPADGGRPRRGRARAQHHADLAARHRQPAPRWTWPRCGGPGRRGISCGCRSATTPAASRWNWTSRNPRRAAWARTAWSSAPPGPASPSCSGRSCSGWPSPTPPRTSTSSWSTSRAARRSSGSTACRTSPP